MAALLLGIAAFETQAQQVTIVGDPMFANARTAEDSAFAVHEAAYYRCAGSLPGFARIQDSTANGVTYRSNLTTSAENQNCGEQPSAAQREWQEARDAQAALWNADSANRRI